VIGQYSRNGIDRKTHVNFVISHRKSSRRTNADGKIMSLNK